MLWLLGLDPRLTGGSQGLQAPAGPVEPRAGSRAPAGAGPAAGRSGHAGKQSGRPCP